MRMHANWIFRTELKALRELWKLSRLEKRTGSDLVRRSHIPYGVPKRA
jgi:hypothetical protein